MKPQTIKTILEQIAQAIKDEQETERVADALRTLATTQGRSLSKKETAGAVQFIREYVQRVPMLLLLIEAMAKQAEISDEVEPLLEAIAAYWQNPHDVIPDHFGLLGVMDDAYYSLSLLEHISKNHEERTGKALISINLTISNRAIRNLIGEPYATQLDLSVMSALGMPALRQPFAQLLQFPSTLQVPDPIWGNISMKEEVDIRVGALGVL